MLNYPDLFRYIYTRANPCIKCTEAAAVRSDVVFSSSNDIGFLSGCSDVCAPLLCLFRPLSIRLLMVVSGAALLWLLYSSLLLSFLGVVGYL